jgi:hypothetical protein
MPLTKPLTIDQINFVHEWYEYDETSESCLRWKKDRGSKMKEGDRAGCLHPNGYWKVWAGKRLMSAHRIIWLLHGNVELPSHLSVDHIDRDPLNNRIENLRPATALEQVKNRDTLVKNTPLSVAGFKWVIPIKDQFRGAFQYKRKHYHCGLFQTPQEAHEAVLRRRIEMGLPV